VKITQSEVKYLRSLQQKKRRDDENKFLLEGWRPLRDALESSYKIEMISVLSDEIRNPDHASLLAAINKRCIPLKELTKVQLKQISDEVNSQGVVALVHQRETLSGAGVLQGSNFIVACDRVSDPGNLGTILRTCDWFGVDTVLLGKGCVSLYNEKVIRSTAGSIFHLNVIEDIDFNLELPNLRSNGFSLLATTLDGKPLDNFHYHQKNILLLGSEAHGIGPELIRLADEAVCIPNYGKAESLNVGIACGVFLAHWRTQLGNK
jgi:RNA methyltransferase, TrmH family